MALKRAPSEVNAEARAAKAKSPAGAGKKTGWRAVSEDPRVRQAAGGPVHLPVGDAHQ